MTPYYLNPDELRMLLQFNGLMHSVYSFMPIKYDDGNKLHHFNKYIFDSLLVAQPGLKKDYDTFKEKVINPSLDENHFFTEIFDGKIMLHCVVDALFHKHQNYNGGEEKRLNTFKTLFKSYPGFFNITHEYIKNNHHKDDDIYDIYFSMLKNSYTKKSGIQQSEMVSNIDQYEYHDKHVKRDINFYRLKIKLAAYLSLHKKDVMLYEHIDQKIGQDVKKNAVLSNLLESKIKYFDSDAVKQYYNNKVQFDAYNESEAYYYSFKTNANYIISKSNVANKTAEDFLLVFHASINNILTTDFHAITKTGEGVLFKSIEDREKAKEFCQLIGDDLPTLLNDKVFKNSYHNNVSYIQEYARDFYAKYTLKQSLENELPVKNKATKSRHKI